MIRLEGVSMYYKESVGLFSTNLIIEPGQIIGLFGENGAGKTTLLSSIMGFVDYSGTITIDENPKFQEICYITENGSYLEKDTPLEFAEFIQRFYEKFDMELCKRLLEMFEIDANKLIKKMSNGQKAKVEVAVGIAKGCRYILMDEPFLGQDIFSRKQCLKTMSGILREDQTILISTHYIEEVENFIDKIIVMKDRNIVEERWIDEIKEEGNTLVEYIEKRYS